MAVQRASPRRHSNYASSPLRAFDPGRSSPVFGSTLVRGVRSGVTSCKGPTRLDSWAHARTVRLRVERNSNRVQSRRISERGWKAARQARAIRIRPLKHRIRRSRTRFVLLNASIFRGNLRIGDHPPGTQEFRRDAEPCGIYRYRSVWLLSNNIRLMTCWQRLDIGVTALKQQSCFDHATRLVLVSACRTEDVTRRVAVCPNKREITTHEEALVLISWRQRNGPACTARAKQ